MDPNPNPNEFQQPVLAAEVVSQPPHKPTRKRTSALGALLLVLLLLGFGASVVLNVVLLMGGALASGGKVQEQHFSHQRYAGHKIAIIPIEGAILSGEGFIKRAIDQAAEDDEVKAIVLRVNSPGGTVTGSDYIYHHLCELAAGRKGDDDEQRRKVPIVVSMGGLAASGGYYVSMAVGDTPESIFAEPTTWTGSIGVMIPHYNAADLLEKCGIEEDSITSHPLKNMTSFTKKMSEEEREKVRAILQELVDESFQRFKGIVKAGRPDLEPEALDELATGEVFTATQAKGAGLIDRIGFIEDAIDRAIELAGVDEDDVCVVRYEPEPTLAGILLGGQARSRGFDLATFVDLTTPRAYYLYTWAPGLIESGQ